VPRRRKLSDVPSGNPYLRRLTDVEATVKVHETRITANERRLREVSLEMALLADMAQMAAQLAVRARRRASLIPGSRSTSRSGLTGTRPK
jgi:hypothetical protein